MTLFVYSSNFIQSSMSVDEVLDRIDDVLDSISCRAQVIELQKKIQEQSKEFAEVLAPPSKSEAVRACNSLDTSGIARIVADTSTICDNLEDKLSSLPKLSCPTTRNPKHNS